MPISCKRRCERCVSRNQRRINAEDLASALDLETDQVQAILEAMQGRVLDGNRLTGWFSRQAQDQGSAERAKIWRETHKTQVPQNKRLIKNRTDRTFGKVREQNERVREHREEKRREEKREEQTPTEFPAVATSPVPVSVSEKPGEPESDVEAERKKRAEIEREWGPALDALLADKSVLAPGRIQLQTQANLQPAQKRPFADRFDTFQLACAECGLSTGSVQMERSNEQWAKLHFVDRVAAVTGLYERKHAGQFKETRYLPKPANYLRDWQWEDPIRYSADNEPFVDPVMAEYKRQDAENRARRAEREAKREIDDAAFRARGGVNVA
jgi:hypothetical protein